MFKSNKPRIENVVWSPNYWFRGS